MPVIVTSRTRAQLLRPPRWPYTLDHNHWSARGLHSLFPLFGPEGLHDLVRGLRLTRSSVSAATFVVSPIGARVLDLSGTIANNEAAIDGVAFPSEPFTLLCWGNLDSTATNNFLMSLANNAATNQQHRVGIEFTGAINTRSFAGGISSGRSISTGTDYLIGGVFSATNARRAFVDGVGDTADTTSSGGPWTLNALSIGTTADLTPFGELNGRVWDARVYDRALSADEMLALRYNPQETWGAYYELGRRTVFLPIVAGGPTTYDQAVPLIVTASPTIDKAIAKMLEGVTATGTLSFVRTASINLPALQATGTGTVSTRQVATHSSNALGTATPTMNMTVSKQLSTIATASPVLLRSVLKQLSVAGTITVTETKRVQHALGALTVTATPTNTPGAVYKFALDALIATATAIISTTTIPAGSTPRSLWRRLGVSIRGRTK